MISKSAKTVLGLDLGVQSLGWTLWEMSKKDGKPQKIVAAGVRCFESGTGTEQDIERGTDESHAAERRNARLVRRQLWRRSRRRIKLFGKLINLELLPPCQVDSHSARQAMLDQLDKKLLDEFFPKAKRTKQQAHTFHYHLRAKALDEKLSAHALGRILYQMAQRRGFLSNRKAVDEAEEGVVKEGIAKLRSEMEAQGSRTLGEYFATLDPEEQKIRSRWTAREMAVTEFNAIIDAQKKFHPCLNDEAIEALRRIIFFQRPLKSQKGRIGKCELYPEARRAPAGCLDHQRFRIWQKVNDLRIIPPEAKEIENFETFAVEVPLDDEERQKLADALEIKEKLSFNEVKKVLGLKGKYAFNLQRGGEKNMPGNKTAARLLNVLGEKWTELTEEKKQLLVDEMLFFEKEDALARRLMKVFEWDITLATEVAAVHLETDRKSLSRPALKKLLPEMQAGLSYASAKKNSFPEAFTSNEEVCEFLPPVQEACKHLNNPVVIRSLTEVRKVVNAIIREHGRPDIIRIEMARDMKRSRDHRKSAAKRMRENETKRNKARAKIIAETGVKEPTRTDILKIQLAEECNWQCPFTGKQITPRTLVGAEPQFDIEHILPYSRTADNSFLNKTLCYHEENRNVKRNYTPYEAYQGNKERYGQILHRVQRFQGEFREKKVNAFKIEKLGEDGFTNRMLNDTRHISKQACQFLGLLYGGVIDAKGKKRVQTCVGGATATLRGDWGLNTILSSDGRKNRDDHRHHAIDAAVIALIDHETVKQLSHAAERASEMNSHRLYHNIETPFEQEDFVGEVRHAIENIIVSYRVGRKVSGALHKQTNYSRVHPAKDAKGKLVEYRHLRKPIENLSKAEVEKIVDPTVRQRVQERLKQSGESDPKKAFAAGQNMPYLTNKEGQVTTLIKSVRIRQNVATIEVGKEAKRRRKGERLPRNVAPGSNHHMEIIAHLDEQGNEVKWEGCVVSMYEATLRLKNKEPVVKKDHGENKVFKFSLANGEYLEMDDPNGEGRILCRVVGITHAGAVGQVKLVKHTDARIQADALKTAGMRPTADVLRKRNVQKMCVTPLGTVHPAND